MRRCAKIRRIRNGNPQPAAQVDAELLEFLGSLDTEGEDWHEFLAVRQIRPETARPVAKPATKPVAKDASQTQPAKQQDKPKTP